jgi:hypothetical protein
MYGVLSGKAMFWQVPSMGGVVQERTVIKNLKKIFPKLLQSLERCVSLAGAGELWASDSRQRCTDFEVGMRRRRWMHLGHRRHSEG